MQRGLLIHLTSYRRLTTALIVGIAVGLTLLLTYALSGGALRLLSLELVGAILALPMAIGLIAKWRWAFYLVIVLLVFEGMFRNLFNQVTILLVKDIVVALTYLGFTLEFGPQLLELLRTRLKSFWFLLMGLLVYSIVEILNPDLASPIIGLIGLKSFLFYVPLFFVAYFLFDQPDKVYHFIILVLGLAIISCLLGAFQYFGGEAVIRLFQPVHVFVSHSNLATYYKLPGTFASPGNFVAYLGLAFSLAMGLLYSKTKQRLNWFSVVTITTICISFVLTTQRGSWVYVLLCFFIATFLQASKKRLITLRVVLAALLVGAFLLAISSTDNVIGDRFSQFTRGTGLQSYILDAPIGQIGAELAEVGQGSLFGKGTGSATPGTRYVDENQQFIESYVAIVLHELGLPGLLLTSALLGLALFYCWQAFTKVSNPSLKNLLFFLFVWELYMLATSFTYAPLLVPPVTEFFWLLPGIALRIALEETTRVTRAKNSRIEFSSAKPKVRAGLL